MLAMNRIAVNVPIVLANGVIKVPKAKTTMLTEITPAITHGSDQGGTEHGPEGQH